MSADAAPRVAVSILVDRPVVERWRAWAAMRLVADERVDVRSVVTTGAGPARGRGGGPGAVLLRAYERADRARRRPRDDALAPTDLAAWLPAPLAAGLTGPPAPARPAEDGADLVLELGGAALPAALVDELAYGAWHVVHEDGWGRPVDPALFWPAYRSQSVVASSLCVRGRAAGGPLTLQRAVSRVDPGSLPETRNTVMWRAAELLVRRIGDLAALGWEALRAGARARAPAAAQPAEAPGAGQVARFLGRLGRRKLGRRLTRAVGEDQWFIAFGPRRDGARMTAVLPPAGRNYADPMLLVEDGVPHVFFEEWDWEDDAAWISYLTIDPRGRASEPRVALRRDHHLSYPFLYREGGEIYMVPESRRNGTIELFRAARFPDAWELERVLFADVDAADTTLVRHGGRTWLFTTIADHGRMPWDELHAFWADSVHGPWTAHPRNPVVTDVRSARGAGRPFLVGGDLVRPAQDCSVGYGARTVLNRIVRLTEDEYEERAVGEIVPRRSTGNRRTHTYCADGGLVVVDGMRRRLRSPLASARLATLRAGPAPVEVRCADPDLAAAIAGGPAPRAAPAAGARRA